MQIKLSFLGAAQNVTGSKYLLDVNNFRIMVDCGLYQDELSKARVVAEAEMTLQSCQQLDVKAVSAYATDIRIVFCPF
jgi:Cft2 family RNA processing exonuclease